MNYMDEIFVDPQDILLRPKKQTNALYFLLLGKIMIYKNSPESEKLIADLIEQKEMSKKRINKNNSHTYEIKKCLNEVSGIFHAVDDDLADFPPALKDDYR